jgi:hypothetical protein
MFAIEPVPMSVTELQQEAGGRLAVPCRGHARAAGCDADLFLTQRFRARVVDVAIRRNAGWIGDDAARGKSKGRQDEQD